MGKETPEKVYLGEFIMNKMSLLFVLFEWGLCESCCHLERSQCFTVFFCGLLL